MAQAMPIDIWRLSVTHLLRGTALVEIPLDDLTPEEVATAPVFFRELCRMTSVSEALTLCARFGGRDISIPAPDTPATHETETRGELRDALCAESYQRFLYECGGNKFCFPKLDGIRRGRRNSLILARIERSFTQKESMENAIAEIVRDFGLHRRHVYRILKKPVVGKARPSSAPASSGKVLPSASSACAQPAGKANGCDAFSMPADSLTPKQPKSRSGSMRGLRHFLEGADKT